MSEGRGGWLYWNLHACPPFSTVCAWLVQQDAAEAGFDFFWSLAPFFPPLALALHLPLTTWVDLVSPGLCIGSRLLAALDSGDPR
jgi:hypothetical protein